MTPGREVGQLGAHGGDPDTSALDRGVRATRLFALLLAAPALVLIALAILRWNETEFIRSRGTRQDAVVMRSSRGPIEGRITVRYDVPDGRILQADVPAARAHRVGTRPTVRIAFDPARPERVRALGFADPGPALYAAPAAALLAAAIALVVSSSVFRRRARRALEGPEARMRATLWRAAGRSRWARLDVPAAEGAPPWWVRLLPRQDDARLAAGVDVTVRGRLADAPVAIQDGDRLLWPARRATTRQPRRATPLTEATASVRSARPVVVATVSALVLGTTPFAIEGPLSSLGFGSAGREKIEACANAERTLGGRSSVVDRSAPTAVDQTSVLTLSRRLIAKPPAGLGFDGVVASVDTFLDLRLAAGTRRDPVEGERVLRRYGYVGGYRRDWTSGGALLTAFVYQFSSPANAAAFDTYANTYVCAFGAETFRVAEVPGAIGSRIPGTAGSVLEQVSFVRGDRRFLVGRSIAGAEADRGPLIKLLTAQANAAE